MIKAIETQWKGYRFRSRLEARWAVFFEHLGVRWDYEPEGFKTGWHEGRQRDWLPDFQIWLRDGKSPYWVEVKGNPNWLREDGFDFCQGIDFGGGPPGFENCGDYLDLQGGIILLGSIPKFTWGQLFVPVLNHKKGVHLTWMRFDSLHPTSALVDGTDTLHFFKQGGSDVLNLDSGKPSIEQADFQPFIGETMLASQKIMEALNHARGARFEHGEKPPVIQPPTLPPYRGGANDAGF